MSRRPIYMVKKWNYDPASTRRSRRAAGILDHAKWSLIEKTSSYYDNQFDFLPEVIKAFEILDAALKQVAKDDDLAQSIAKKQEQQ